MEKRNAWLEFFVAMLKKNNTDVLRRGYQAFYEWGTDMQKGKTNQMVEYSFDFYDGIITINETLCEQNKKAITIANGSDFITILLDKMQGTIIAPKTFSVIWICLNQQLFYNRQEWVMNYWITAHQYYLFNLPKYYENQKEINLDGSPFLITQEQVQLRDLERKEFFDFHIALGGLLLYRKEYDLLKQIIYYSNSQPPQYVLIPGRFAEIYLLYMDLLSCFPINNYESKYPFLNLQAGIRNENIIKGWILKYLILLMLRLYTVVETYSTYNSFGLPGIPQKLMEKKGWLNNIPIIKQNLEDESIDEWSVHILPLEKSEIKSKRKELMSLVNEIESELNKSMKHQIEEQPLSEDEILSFHEIVSTIVDRNMSQLGELFPATIDKNYNDYETAGRLREVEPSEIFSDEKTMSYVNFKESLSYRLIDGVRYNFLRTFLLQKRLKKYRVFAENIEESFQRLGYDKEKHIILGFHVNWLSIFKEGCYKVNDFLYKTSDGLELHNIQGDNSLDFINNIVIMDKQNLPGLYFLEPDQSAIDRYGLKCSDQKYKIYLSEIKLNTSSDILTEVHNRGTYTKEELRESVLVCGELNIHTRWKKNVPIALIRVLYQYRDNGNDNLSEIVPLC
ncbi:hypothetical protein [Bacteroides ovatus]|uniref:hypothetical protein n=1 Tax=Bacteroides ovatus TaxID=28116 RepID=UPI0022DF8CBA|nr:hypothetical protein [Bacteroides ovatus]UYI64235.1 MAG: hypothetical protein OGM04_02140 [Bacteroides ovatus]